MDAQRLQELIDRIRSAWKLTKSSGEQLFDLPISEIVEDSSPRHEPAHLFEQGWSLIGKHREWQPPLVKEGVEAETRLSLIEMAIHKDIETVRRFVTLIETYEVAPNRTENPAASQSIVELAHDLAAYHQLYPVLVHQICPNQWRLVRGSRRVTAILYNHAKGRVDRYDEVKGEVQFPATAKAINAQHITKNDATRLAVIANLSRKQFTPLQEARIYYEKCEEIDPETGKKYTIRQAADSLGVEYFRLRNLRALMLPCERPENERHNTFVNRSR